MQVKPCLKRVLKEQNMTQYELSRRSGIKQAYLSRFDLQISHKDDVLFGISRALGLRIEDLFEVTEEDK